MKERIALLRAGTNFLTSFQNDKLEQQNHTQAHGVLFSQITPQRTSSFAPPSNNSCKKKFSTTREKQDIAHSQNGLEPFLPAVREPASALRQGPKGKKNLGLRFRGYRHPETDFSARSFCRHPFFISKGSGAIVSMFDFIMKR